MVFLKYRGILVIKFALRFHTLSLTTMIINRQFQYCTLFTISTDVVRYFWFKLLHNKIFYESIEWWKSINQLYGLGCGGHTHHMLRKDCRSFQKHTHCRYDEGKKQHSHSVKMVKNVAQVCSYCFTVVVGVEYVWVDG